MKYGVIIGLALLASGCQRAVPTEVIGAGDGMAMETAKHVSAESPAPVSQISNEQDFEVVATAQTVESDAERIAANRAKYIVMDVQALPRRPGRRPNVVDYALRTNNPIGVQLYNRFGTGLKVISFGGCDRYRSMDEAQQDFLAKGGPERDAYGLDPDGDGFACGWDPRPFRLAVAN